MPPPRKIPAVVHVMVFKFLFYVSVDLLCTYVQSSQSISVFEQTLFYTHIFVLHGSSNQLDLIK